MHLLDRASLSLDDVGELPTRPSRARPLLRPVDDDRRRHVAGAAQHRRRAGARPARRSADADGLRAHRRPGRPAGGHPRRSCDGRFPLDVVRAIEARGRRSTAAAGASSPRPACSRCPARSRRRARARRLRGGARVRGARARARARPARRHAPRAPGSSTAPPTGEAIVGLVEPADDRSSVIEHPRRSRRAARASTTTGIAPARSVGDRRPSPSRRPLDALTPVSLRRPARCPPASWSADADGGRRAAPGRRGADRGAAARHRAARHRARHRVRQGARAVRPADRHRSRRSSTSAPTCSCGPRWRRAAVYAAAVTLDGRERRRPGPGGGGRPR